MKPKAAKAKRPPPLSALKVKASRIKSACPGNYMHHFYAHQKSPFFRPCLFIRLALLFFALGLSFHAPAAQAARGEHNVGYRSLQLWRPDINARAEVAVWYPCTTAMKRLVQGEWSFTAALNAQVSQGPWPLVIISPDSSGTRFSHHDLASNLASRGMIVAVPSHDGDNLYDMRRIFTEDQLPARARQLTGIVDLLEKHPDLGPQISSQAISALGFGNGGSAILLLAGARLSPDLWPEFCVSSLNRNSEISQASPYCESLMAHNMNRLTLSMRVAKNLMQEAELNRNKAQEARINELKKAQDNMRKAQTQVNRETRSNSPLPPVFLPTLPPLPQEEQLSDARFGKLALINPGLAMLFEPESLQSIKLPILIVNAGQDKLNLPQEQGLVLHSQLAKSLVHDIEQADGLALQSPCPQSLAEELPELCQSVSPGVRNQSLQKLENLLLDFLLR